ncbi:hypothetical protein [Aeromicrobium sp.]|uniref:hypothetical protein n=1 Tax=Aeromicrobium sp. TaxID=1871063 RepID=UPI003C33C0AC
MSNIQNARNDNDNAGNADNAGDDTEQDGQLANPGPVPAEPEDAADTGEGRSGDLAAEAGPARDD